MKNIQSVFSAAVCGLVVAFTAAASAQDIKQGVATVVRVQGPASYTLESGPNPKWIPLVAGKVLMAGSSIRTGPDATVDMVLGKNIQMPQAHPSPDRIAPAADAAVRGLVAYTPAAEQNTVRMTGETTLKIDKLTISDTGVDTVSDTELDLQKGRIFANVKKLSAASQYLIKIPSGIAGVRGTFFGIDASGWCAVLRHQVDLALFGSDGKVVTHTVGEGNQFDPGTGQTTPLPQSLLNFLGQVSSAINTTYLSVVSFASPLSNCYISPKNGHHKGGGNSGNGGGNQP
ncbi:MAG: FecR domain-containing protein [Verrucomicrobiales bacterium]|nr:FecR domain-containing protein [Verrucomicrobiales bacterium]